MELDEFAVSYKPQKISPKFGGSVRLAALCLLCLLLLPHRLPACACCA